MKAIGLAVLLIIAVLLLSLAVARYQDRQGNQCSVYEEYGKLRAGANLDLAIDACTAIIQSGDESTKGLTAVFLNRGSAYVSKGDYDRAIRDFDQAIKLDPNLAEAFNNRGATYNNKREYDRAVRDFKAIRLDPDYTRAFNNRGYANGNKREYDRAVQDFDQAIRLDPNYASAFPTKLPSPRRPPHSISKSHR